MSTVNWGDALRASRRRAGLSQRELADLAGLSQSVVSLMEGGYFGSKDSRDRLAAALNYPSPDDLFPPR